jgi:[NiFe] hydrogenase assembly HybE family chaperone
MPMQIPGPDDYARLHALAAAWTGHHLKAAKRQPCFNPRLGVDTLCFQRHDEGLLGVLVTPVSLSLVCLPDHGESPPGRERYRLSLPSGQYDFLAKYLGDEGLWLWRCELLDDLSDIASREQVSRLAQQLMERVMTPAVG